MNRSKTIITILVLTSPAFFAIPELKCQEATVREEKMIFPTFPFYDPSPLANIGRIYPYFRFDGYTVKGQNRAWNMVVLENPYIRVLAAPQIGGKVWGAIEKKTGKAFIYQNPVVKFRDIALRGPWTSGGIEFNFGIIGHTPSGATPVDYIVRNDPDGSACLVVGGLDLASRTEWRVFVRLPRDKAYLDTSAFWYNATPLHQSCYNWMTAAADAAPDLRLHIPGTHYIGHSGDAHPWPVDAQGRDLSLYANNNFGGPKSYHVLGQYTDWFGGYYEKEDFGWGHWAPHSDRPGKKIWIWALSREGEIWRDLLTDPPARQYVEMQTGLMHSQANDQSSTTPFKHAFLQPYTHVRWRELWFPVKKIGGMVTASPCGVLNTTLLGNRLNISLCALQAIDDELNVSSGNTRIVSKKIKIAALEIFEMTVALTNAEESYSIDLGNGKLHYNSDESGKNRLNRPLSSQEKFDWDASEGLYLAGEEFYRQRNYQRAGEKYSACIQKEPDHLRALARLAELCCRSGMQRQAVYYAKTALAIDTYDAAANYVYGLASGKLGHLADAKEAFGWAARSPEYRSAAYTELAAAGLMEKEYAGAADNARRALDYDMANIRALQLLAASLRQQNRQKEAAKVLDRLLQLDPLNHFARFEKFLCTPAAQTEHDFTSMIRSEMPHETYLELAFLYTELGLTAEAARMLEKAPVQPMVLLTLAYLLRTDSLRSTDLLKKALALPAERLFPFRPEEIQVLDWACSQSYQWKPKYYLALLFWSLGREKEAAQLFLRCGNAADEACFYLNRARFRQAQGQKEGVEADLQKAQKLNPRQWRAYHLLACLYQETGRYPDALAISRDGLKHCAGHGVLTLDAARAMLACGKHAEARNLLAGAQILPFEGARQGRDLWRQACLLLAIEKCRAGDLRTTEQMAADARLWPEHLGAGKPYVSDERFEDFLSALIAEKRGDRNSAKIFFDRIAAFTAKEKPSFASGTLVSAIAHRRLGRTEEAGALMLAWRAATSAGDPVIAWAESVWQGKRPPAALLANDGDDDWPLLILLERAGLL